MDIPNVDVLPNAHHDSPSVTEYTDYPLPVLLNADSLTSFTIPDISLPKVYSLNWSLSFASVAVLHMSLWFIVSHLLTLHQRFLEVSVCPSRMDLYQ